MPSVCQSRPSEVHTEQSSRNGKPLSKLVASGLVASCFILVLGFTNDMHLPVTDYTSASGIQHFLQQFYCFLCCLHCMACITPECAELCMSATAFDMASLLTECKHAIPSQVGPAAFKTMLARPAVPVQ